MAMDWGFSTLYNCVWNWDRLSIEFLKVIPPAYLVFAGQVKSRQAEISVTQGFQKQKLQAAALYVYTEPV